MRKLLIVLSVLFSIAGCASPGTWDRDADQDMSTLPSSSTGPSD